VASFFSFLPVYEDIVSISFFSSGCSKIGRGSIPAASRRSRGAAAS